MMKTSILSFLETSAARLPEKTSFAGPDSALSFAQLLQKAQSAGTCLALQKGFHPRRPIVFLLEKSPLCVAGFLGAIYAGCFYVMLDPKHPVARLCAVLEVLHPTVLVTDAAHTAQVQALAQTSTQIPGSCAVLQLEDICETPVNAALLAEIRAQATDLDPLYTNFTSGSTGTPKGVVVGHRSVIDFIESFTSLFDITETDVIANQAPFDFDVSVKDIYSGLATGATVQIIPRAYFSFPTKLMDFLCERKVTVLTWAVSALCFVTTMQGLAYKVPRTVQKILFSGEVMPIKHLNIWRSFLPDALYVNVYGPTEITCNCLYYIVDRTFSAEERLPLGRSFPNENVFLLDEHNRLVTQPGALGEICVGGSCLALGYYGDTPRTAQSFVQNPLNSAYRDIVYRTGDLAQYSEAGELFYISRKDFQIKHMGHRVELGEIEHALQAVEGVNRACCLYHAEKQRIVAFYDGTAEKKQALAALRTLLPAFMLPNTLVPLLRLPITANGKIDRAALREQI